MGVRDTAPQRGTATAGGRDADSSGRVQCGFCDVALPAAGDDAEERVVHRLPTDDGAGRRRVDYCSPSCFIRDMKRAAGIDGHHAD